MKFLPLLILLTFSLFANDSNTTDYEQLGITQETWSFNIALLANMVGFTIFFLVNFLSILVMRR